MTFGDFLRDFALITLGVFISGCIAAFVGVPVARAILRDFGINICLALALSGCSLSMLGDATSDCYRLEAAVSALGRRCGGHELAEGVFRCDAVLYSSVTSAGVDDCEAYTTAVACEDVAASGWHLPDECRFSFTRTP